MPDRSAKHTNYSVQVKITRLRQIQYKLLDFVLIPTAELGVKASTENSFEIIIARCDSQRMHFIV